MSTPFPFSGLSIAIYWGRAPRGRVWHLIAGPPGKSFCSEEFDAAEVSGYVPPMGGRVCPRCVDRVGYLRGAVDAALAQESFVTGEPAPNEYTTEAGANP